MGQVIQFPTGAVELAPEATVPVARKEIAAHPSPVSPIRKGRRVPKQNREEDQTTIIIAKMARSFSEKAYALAQTEPNSEQHRLALHMTRLAEKLPCNNLRIFTTPDDVVEGIVCAWRRVKIANLEWQLCSEQRFHAAMRQDVDGQAHWSAKEDAADEKRWLEYERLLRIPATRLFEIKNYKMHRHFEAGIGNLEWMRRYKPELAAILDDELHRLNRAQGLKKAARASKRQEVA